MGTLGSVGLARFAVQVALAYEMDAREIPSNWTTGYWLQGTSEPGTMDGIEIYGTEVFELNTNLRDMAFGWIQGVTLNDTTDAQAWRSKFAYAPANEAPKVFKGDVATSDVYFAGDLLANAFANITSLWTNNTGEYAFTAQEDNATFEAMVRAHKAGLMDFARVILMRTASDMDRAPEGGVDEVADFLASQGGYAPALENIWVAGSVIVQVSGRWGGAWYGGEQPSCSGAGEGWGGSNGLPGPWERRRPPRIPDPIPVVITTSQPSTETQPQHMLESFSAPNDLLPYPVPTNHTLTLPTAHHRRLGQDVQSRRPGAGRLPVQRRRAAHTRGGQHWREHQAPREHAP